MAHFISESTVHEYQYSIEHFPETSSLMTSGSGTNYDFSICSRSSHSSLSSLSLKELWTSFPDVDRTCLIWNIQPVAHSGASNQLPGANKRILNLRTLPL